MKLTKQAQMELMYELVDRFNKGEDEADAKDCIALVSDLCCVYNNEEEDYNWITAVKY